MISRYSEDVKNEYGRLLHNQDEIYQVNDTEYFGEIMSCDSAEIYGGDKELTNTLNKNVLSSFDLLRMSVTAEIADLWNEYAIATKGKTCFRFARVFKQVIDEYLNNTQTVILFQRVNRKNQSSRRLKIPFTICFIVISRLRKLSARLSILSGLLVVMSLRFMICFLNG